MYNLHVVSFNGLGAHYGAPVQTVSVDPTTGQTLAVWWIVGNCSPRSVTLYGAGTRVTLKPDDAGVTIYGLSPAPLIL